MNFKGIGLIFLSMLLAIVIGCGSEKKADTTPSFYPELFDKIGMERSSEIRTFKDNSLWEYIDGGAEIYLAYNFIQVITADYKKDKVEIVADIYQFKTDPDAYGLYSVFRPPDANIIKLGVEGFVAPATINFVKGSYLVRLTGYDDTEEGSLALINLAEELAKLVPGGTEIPPAYSLFPPENRVSNTTQYYSESFSGQKFLTEVYSIDYKIGEDSVTLFLLSDSTGHKYAEWLAYSEKIDKKKAGPKNVVFDENYSFIYVDSYYGEILIGLKSGRLAGIINFKNEQIEFINHWLESLK
ncbi:MAG: DUF6599 family protein [Candidatus Zixiibacteriota bacterium]